MNAISLGTLQALAQVGVERYGYWGLLALGFSVAVYQPMAPDVFLVAGSSLGMNPCLAVFVALMGTLAGSAGGYALGRFVGRKVLYIVRIKEHRLQKAEALFRRYGMWGVALAALSPIPLRETSWLAGAFGMPPRLFLMAVALGIGPRYCGAVFLGHLLGKAL
ncbi:MAG: DedA family protein [Candidatus Latescibacterota bacterium]|nr:MAG: DedA family protein [Candidatus Latescibacterota bacterium]